MSFDECSTSRSMAENESLTCLHKRSKSCKFPDNKSKEDQADASQCVYLQETKLIREIAVLEYEVSHLEQHLLSLYRKAFVQQISRASTIRTDQTLKPQLVTPKGKFLETSRDDIPLQANANECFKDDEVLDSGVQQCHSSVTRTTSPKILGKSLRGFHSQQPSMTEYAQNSSIITSLAGHLHTKTTDNVLETPNKVSEDMVKCMCAIYCKLADPQISNRDPSSPTSCLSSIGSISTKDHPDMTWGPGFRRDSSSFHARLDNPLCVQELKELSGPYHTMVDIQQLYINDRRLGEIDHMLQHFRLLVSRLKEVDPKKLKHEEKLAFWINVHNALVMHAFLAYGIPQNHTKRVFLLLKAAYNIGGHIISADLIKSYILGGQMSRPGQWMRLLLSSRSKLRSGEKRQEYAIGHQEPLLHFALCSGCHSDPAVRVYTPKQVFQELETAKEEYIRATFTVGKDQRFLLPKLVKRFAKDSGLCAGGLIEIVQVCLPDTFSNSLKKHHLVKLRRKIGWVPHDFSFRYLISKELAK